MKKILLFAGSNNPLSINQQLVNYAHSMLAGHHTTLISLRDLPLPVYSPETEETEGYPENAVKLAALLAAHDAVVMAVPEHNGSLPAVLKNALDWASRVGEDWAIFKDKTVLLLGTSPGNGGAGMALQHAADVVRQLGGTPVAQVSVPRFYDKVQADENGVYIRDEQIRQELEEQVGMFAARLLTGETVMATC